MDEAEAEDSVGIILSSKIDCIDIWNPPPSYPFDIHSTNTLSRKPVIFQIASYLLVIAHIIVFYACLI